MRPQYAFNDTNTWIDAPEGMRLLFRDIASHSGEKIFAQMLLRNNGFFVELIDQDTGEVHTAEISLSDMAKLIAR